MWTMVVVGGILALGWTLVLLLGAWSLRAHPRSRPRRRLLLASIFLPAISGALLYGLPNPLALGVGTMWFAMLLIPAITSWFARPVLRIPSAASETPAPVDERDLVPSRMHYVPGRAEYEEYYGRNPGREEGDAHTRDLPAMGSPGTPAYDDVAATQLDSLFRMVGAIPTTPPSPRPCMPNKGNPLRDQLETAAARMGAVALGMTQLRSGDVYSHRSGRAGEYGEPVAIFHRHAVVFAVEMDARYVGQAPKLQASVESASAYLSAAIVGRTLADVLLSNGFDARVHRSGDYLVVLPQLAARAGLGEIGMMGLLITEQWGPRVRLGAVTTDAPLPVDAPISFGLETFCPRCGRCAVNCPGGAISRERQETRGVTKWGVVPEDCYRYWRRVGSDCGICLSVCPYGGVEWPLRGLLKRLVRRRPGLARLLSGYDDVVYGPRLHGLLRKD